MRVLVTRPEADAASTMARVAEAGHHPIACPVVTVRLMPDVEIPTEPFTAIIATSRHAIGSLADRTDVNRWRSLPVACVGAATATVARDVGFKAVIEGGGDAASLVDVVRAQSWSGAVLYVSGTVVTRDLAADLDGSGVNVIRVPVYDVLPVEKLEPDVIDIIKTGTADGVLFYSPRTVRIFAALLTETGLGHHLNDLTAHCLSDKIGTEARLAGFKEVVIADKKSEVSLVASLSAVR